jgi:hypothetical protein
MINYPAPHPAFFRYCACLMPYCYAFSNPANYHSFFDPLSPF